MELNTQIWGNSTEWQEDTIISYNNGNAPKAYHGKYLSLGDYRNNGLVEFNTPIDNSIAYCGHAPNVSPYGDRAVYFWEAGDTPTITPRWRCRDKCDIALFDVSNGTANYNLDLLYGVRGFVEQNGEWLTETGFTRWLDYGNINPRYPDDYKQENLVVQPVVEFDPRIMFGVIMVTYYDENNEMRTTTLHELESNPNHNNCQIINAELSPAIVKEWYNNDNFGRYGTIIYDENKTFNMLSLTPINIDNGKILTYNTRMYRNAKFPLVGCESIIGVYSKIEIEHAAGDYPVKVSWNNYHYNNSDKEWGDEMSAGLILYGNSLLNVGNATAEHRTDYDINSIYYSCNATTETCEKIRRLAACYGLFFTDNPTNLYNNPDRWTNSDMMLGLLVDGVGYGDYTRGSENVTNPAYNWNSSHDSGYDPSIPVDPNTYSNTTIFNPVLDLHSMTKRYVLDAAAVDQLGRDLWKISSDLASVDPSDMFKNYEDLLIDNFLTNDPIKCIVSLDKYPITNIPTGHQKEPIRYGKVTGTAQGRPFDKTSYQFTFQSVSIYPRFGKSFLDYEPYTHYELYIPFCGVAQIDPGDIMGKRLSVIEVLDFSTGAVTAYILANELVINSLTGTCNINIPVTGTDGITLNAQINNGILNMKRSQGNAFLGSILSTFTLGGLIKAGSDPAGSANKFMQGQLDVAQTSYELQHTQVPMHTIGAASAVGSWTIELNCRLLIYYPTGEAVTDNVPPSLSDLSEYGHTTGFACVLNGKVSDFTGLTVGNIILDGVNSTEEEKKMIQALFSQGVYL